MRRWPIAACPAPMPGRLRWQPALGPVTVGRLGDVVKVVRIDAHRTAHTRAGWTKSASSRTPLTVPARAAGHKKSSSDSPRAGSVTVAVEDCGHLTRRWRATC